MGFLDNSGDILLDAVLTDAGRKRLARGDGTFKITKYAFGDDEIDYAKYDPDNTSGSAYYDLEILQTPILEAFTNNRSSLKSKLLSITNNNLLYLPELVLNEKNTAQPGGTARPTGAEQQSMGSGSFYVAVTNKTVSALTNQDGYDTLTTKVPFINGTMSTPTVSQTGYIRIDQGLNTVQLSAVNRLSPELTENQYLIEMDNRLGQLVDVGFGNEGGAAGSGLQSPAFIDDDQIASYYITRGVGGFIKLCATGPLTITGGVADANTVGGEPDFEKIVGPRGTKLGFGVFAKQNLIDSSYLFDTIGETGRVFSITGPTDTYSTISSTIRVTGVTTGYRIDIPVTFVKYTGS